MSPTGRLGVRSLQPGGTFDFSDRIILNQAGHGHLE